MTIYIVDSLKTDKQKKKVLQKLKLVDKLRERDKVLTATEQLNTIILSSLDFEVVSQKIANSIPQFLGYQTGVLALINEKKGTLDRVAISETSGGVAALQFLEVPFSRISIKLTEKDNYCIKALNERRALYTTHLYDVLRPAISQENSKKVQAMMKTQTTLIYPILLNNKKPYGTFLVSMDKKYEDITDYERQTINNYVDGIKIALNNAKYYSSLNETKERLQRANKRLKELDKLKDEFVSLASHELRTPMTAIKSYLWMALDGKGGKLNEKQTYYVQRGYNSVDRLIRLVNDMLNISRIESGRITVVKQPIDLQRCIQEVIEEVTPRAQELQVTIVFEKHKEDQIVIADSEKIKEVLFNLIGNALKFTPPKGKITVSLTHKNGRIETTVKDTGIGIPAEDIGKLFQRFGMLAGSYTTNQPLGTGLGLYISKSIMNMHEGEIWATSEGRGKGARFTFSLSKPTKEDIIQASRELPDQSDEEVGLIHANI